MKIKVYTNVYEDAFEANLRFVELTIEGKLVRFVILPKNNDEVEQGLYEDSARLFSYQYDDTFYDLFPNLRLNTKINVSYSSIHEYEEPSGLQHWDESSIGGKEGYCHLTTWQKSVLDFRFKKTWIQKERNLKWLISSLIALAGVVVTFILSARDASI